MGTLSGSEVDRFRYFLLQNRLEVEKMFRITKTAVYEKKIISTSPKKNEKKKCFC